MQDDSVAAPKSGLVRVTSGLVHKYFDHLQKRLGKASNTGVCWSTSCACVCVFAVRA